MIGRHGGGSAGHSVPANLTKGVDLDPSTPAKGDELLGVAALHDELDKLGFWSQPTLSGAVLCRPPPCAWSRPPNRRTRRASPARAVRLCEQVSTNGMC